jgi:hypothetical protein
MLKLTVHTVTVMLTTPSQPSWRGSTTGRYEWRLGALLFVRCGSGNQQLSKHPRHLATVFITYFNFNFNLFSVRLIHRGYDPSDMELVNTEINLQMSCMK